MSIKFGSIIFVIMAVFLMKLSFDNYSSAQAKETQPSLVISSTK